MYATLMNNFISLLSPTHVSLGPYAQAWESEASRFSLLLLLSSSSSIIASNMCGVFDVEMEHGLFPPHRPHGEGACLLSRPKG